MSRVNDTQSFIKRAKEIHGDKFDYSEVKYVRSIQKVVIVCPTGHKFLQTPNSHLTGQGCSVCARALVGTWNQKSLLDFLARSKKVHGECYDYSEVEYHKENLPVKIICKSGHEPFWQTPNNHYGGQGCPECGRKLLSEYHLSSLDEFIPKAVARHGDLYSYSNSEYVDSYTKIEISCNECRNNFFQTPNNHLGGNGCPRCKKSGFSVVKEGSLYVAACKNIVKIGITNKTPDFRLEQISRSKGEDFELIKAWTFAEGQQALSMETYLLRVLRKSYQQPTHKFDGSTECFIGLEINSLEPLIHKYLENKEIKWSLIHPQILEGCACA